MPRVVSPVRTAPKGWRSTKRRFVINMRYLNNFIPEEESSCELDTLSKIRSMFQIRSDSDPTWGFTMDLASGYHNFRIATHQQSLMGIAIHAAELPVQAIWWLRADASARGCEDKKSGLFYFTIVALPFGLGPSCAVFSDIVTALAASWRRHRVCLQPIRLSSYIDDFCVVSPSVRAALLTVSGTRAPSSGAEHSRSERSRVRSPWRPTPLHTTTPHDHDAKHHHRQSSSCTKRRRQG